MYTHIYTNIYTCTYSIYIYIYIYIVVSLIGAVTHSLSTLPFRTFHLPFRYPLPLLFPTLSSRYNVHIFTKFPNNEQWQDCMSCFPKKK